MGTHYNNNFYIKAIIALFTFIFFLIYLIFCCVFVKANGNSNEPLDINDTTLYSNTNTFNYLYDVTNNSYYYDLSESRNGQSVALEIPQVTIFMHGLGGRGGNGCGTGHNGNFGIVIN